MTRLVMAGGLAVALAAGLLSAFLLTPASGKPCNKHFPCPPPTTTTGTTPTTTTAPPPPASTYFVTDPSAACASRFGCPSSLPRSASTCTAAIIRDSHEPRQDNVTANQTVGDGSYTWGGESAGSYWTGWVARVGLVAGQFTGTTTEHFSWAGCRWGIDEDLLRAVAVQESDWHSQAAGDVCGPVGEASYGLMQIKNKYCNGQTAWGGWPDTVQSTAVNVDFYGAYLRTCYDGDFYDGGSWLYGGKTVAQIAATNGWPYVLWGCVGSWFSGGWYDSGASNYINSVKAHLANRDWTRY